MRDLTSVLIGDPGRHSRPARWTARGAVLLIVGVGAMMVLNLRSEEPGVNRDRSTQGATTPAPVIPTVIRRTEPTPSPTADDTSSGVRDIENATSPSSSSGGTTSDSSKPRARPTQTPTAPPGKPQ